MTAKLLFFRASPLIIRPLAILSEGLWLDDVNFLVFVIPSAMMILLLSSVPVHLQYFMELSRGRVGGENKFTTEYMSSVFILMVLFSVSGVLILSMTPLFNSGGIKGLAFPVVAVFCLEKISDEVSRILEFKKKFSSWFYVQIVRSSWLFIPLLLALLGFDYFGFFIIIACAVLFFFLVIFCLMVKKTPGLYLIGLLNIYKNVSYAPGNFLSASYSQFPRVFVSGYYPDIAHAYVVISQLLQGGSILFNVKFQIPYRKAISRHPILFQKKLKKVMYPAAYASSFVAVMGLAFSGIIYYFDFNVDALIMFFLVALLVAENITSAIVFSHLGYLHWFASKKEVLTTYFLCAGGALAGMVSFWVVFKNATVIAVPAMVTMVGCLWMLIINFRHFTVKNNV